MKSRRKPSTRGMLGALALAIATAAPSTSQEPVFVRRLELPIAGDAIGYPRGVTADPHTEEIFIGDSRGNRILIYDGEGRFKFQITGGDVFSAPHDIAIDPEGYLVVVANHQRRRALIQLDFDGLFLDETPLTGLPDDSMEPMIHSIALSPSGDRIYAVDTANLRLWIADRSGAIATSVDLAPGLSEKERHDVMLGHVDVYGETVLLAVPSSAEIRVFDLDGSAQGRVGERGGGFCKLGRPAAAALTDNGELVVVDQQRMVVTRWALKGDRCLGEYYGLGNRDGFLYFPLDLTLDGKGQLYVVQGYQGRVQMYEGMQPAAAPPRSP
ncbi:MAG: NHL repeat-containing protein [Thermoanaerobaculia bacterium]